MLPAARGLSSVQLKLESELQILIADGEKTTLDADEIRNEQRKRLRASLESLKSHFDVVIIDTPGLGAGEDALMIAVRAGAALAVARSSQTRVAAFSDMVHGLASSGVAMIGSVLNDVPAKKASKRAAQK